MAFVGIVSYNSSISQPCPGIQPGKKQWRNIASSISSNNWSSIKRYLRWFQIRSCTIYTTIWISATVRLLLMPSNYLQNIIILQKTWIKNLSYYNIFRLHETRSSRHQEIPKGETSSSRSLLNDMFKHLAARQYENKDSIDQILPGSHDPRGRFIFQRMLGITIFY